MIDWTILAPAAFFAGMVDAVVGGGGLIQIPVLLGQFPQTAIPTLFGTNKLSSIAGTGAALWRYTRSVRIPWLVVLPGTAAALVGAWAGAALVAWLPRETMRPLVVVLMIAVALYTFMRKDFGQQVTRVLTGADRWKGAAFGGVIGIVQPDTDELGRARHTGAKPRIRRHHRQGQGVKAAQPGKARIAEHIAGNIGDHAAKVADRAVAGQHPGLFRAPCPMSQQFHVVSSFCRVQVLDQPPSITWAMPVV